MDFTVNFDIFGGLTLDEWLDEDDKENAKPTRHCALSKEELDKLESRFELNTARTTTWAVKCFRDLLLSYNGIVQRK